MLPHFGLLCSKGEKERIEVAGGSILNGRQAACSYNRLPVSFLSRVNGQLAVSRAFGDVNFKFSKEESCGGGGDKALAERDYVLAPASTPTPVTCR